MYFNSYTQTQNDILFGTVFRIEILKKIQFKNVLSINFFPVQYTFV